jgi:hypothetical protein
MRPKEGPALLASALPPHLLALTPAGERPMMACPAGCGQWIAIKRSLLKWHKIPGTDDDCPGSARKVRIDLTYTQWRARLRDNACSADYRRSTPTHRRPQPPGATPVFRIHRAA